MLSPAELYTEHERLALANLQSTLRYSAFAHDAFASLAVVQLVSGTLATGATLGLFIYEYLAAGPQRLLLLSLLRLLLLLCAGLVAFKAFGQRAHSFLGLSRPALYRVAVYLQLLWLALELLLGSALLVFVPLLRGTELSSEVVVDSESSWASSLFVQSLPVFYMVGTAGCLCFLTQIRNRRRFKDGRGPLSPTSYSSSFYDSESVKCPGRLISSGGRDPPPAVTCEIVLMEHQLDTNESVLFVHKKLRPIKTRPDDARPGTNYLPLLKPLIHSGKSIAPQQLPAQQPPQQQQPHRQPPPPPQQQQAPNLICLSSASTTTTAATTVSRVQRSGGSSTSSGGGSQASFTSPMQRLQQLASSGVMPQQQPQQHGSFSFASMRDYVPGLAPHHLSSCAGGSASSGGSGARSIAGLA